MTTIQNIFKKSAERAPIVEEFGRINMIATERICPNPNQPRRTFEDDSIIRLADSIRRFGILQPLTVRRVEGDGLYSSVFEIVAGERRFRAAKLLGLENVPCIIIRVDDRRSAELAIIENIQRENLNLFEQASAIASLIDMYGLTQEEVARQLSTSQSFVANKLRILRLTAPEREKILRHGLTERHARALLRISTVDERMRVIDYICAHSLNVAATEAYIDRCIAESESSRKPKTPRKIVLKDIRVFYNSVDRAVSTMKQAGIDVAVERADEGDATVLTIRVPNNVSRETLS